ncbi:MAG: EamA family transporter [Bryobacteraceae bacterium]
MQDAAGLRVKTGITTLVVVASNVCGNFALTWGMRRVGSPAGPLQYLAAFLDPWVFTGVLLLLLWMLSHMALLSWADLSYVLPVTAIGYALAALAGRLFLNEQISVARWTGIVLITGGVALVGGTHPRSTEDPLP